MEISPAMTIPSDTTAEGFAARLSAEIIRKYEKPLLCKIIDSEFSHISPDDRRAILTIALRNLSPEEDEILGMLHYSMRKALIEADICDYLSENTTLIPDGLINFRLNDYKDELRRIVSAAADEFAAEKEYAEFIEMLKFFVSVQSPREELVHVVHDENGLHILNRRRRDITNVYSREFAQTGEGLTNDDIALSALIAIAPQHITIHDAPSANPLYTTIEAIFPDVIYR